MPHTTPDDMVARARDALARFAWTEALELFERAVAKRESAEAYEGLGWAAWWCNDAEKLLPAREAAFRLYRQAGDQLGAARAAMWLAADHADFRGELSVAAGWRQRAHRLLDGVPLAPEHGWERLLAGDAALLNEGDTVTAHQCADEVLAIGRHIPVVDFTILPLALHGLALVDEGQIDEGMQLLDEAAVAALGERLAEPFWESWAICYLLFACERARDFGRASQWCDRLRELSERYDMPYGLGICRVHYAAVLLWQGNWSRAEEHLVEGATILERTRAPWAAEAFVRLAELRRRQGRLDEAGALFAKLEWHPLAQLGLAELALDSGKPRDAEEHAERALRQIPQASRHHRANALELLVRARALLGHRSRAADTLASLHTLCGEMTPTPSLRAATEYSAGMVAVGARDLDEARAHFEDAVTLFERVGAPYEAARSRLELASVLVSLDRLERAQSEARGANAALEQLDSRVYASRAAALLRDIHRRMGPEVGGRDGDPKGPGLTRRQVQILRLIAHGRSDREIAATLSVSEHTVHRHVANILQRLETPTRAAAAAVAATRGLI